MVATASATVATRETAMPVGPRPADDGTTAEDGVPDVAPDTTDVPDTSTSPTG